MSDPYRQLFRGSSAAETEDFIQAVRSGAWSEQKQFDDRWMAAYAAAQMSGPALRWHMSLPRDVQTEWSKLESALLDRFAPNPPAAAAEYKSVLTLGVTKMIVCLSPYL
ncbi:hypothetical protein FRB90_009362 [Tulasnella sp. 427]|nr:hypothetical protein FRB90_009362 [Tulasnella sp. 427]